MSGETNLNKLLKQLNPEIDKTDYIFATFKGEISDFLHLEPILIFKEEEGISLIITKNYADLNSVPYEGTYNKITLKVHSSLEAVGLTAAVSTKLKEHNISANVVAAYYHDHIFIQSEKSIEALKALKEL